MPTRVHHPIFARMYRRIADEAEDKGASEHRDELLTGLSGRVVEVGAGTGLNFAHYPTTVRQVLAIEPESYLRGVAEAAVANARRSRSRASRGRSVRWISSGPGSAAAVTRAGTPSAPSRTPDS